MDVETWSNGPWYSNTYACSCFAIRTKHARLLAMMAGRLDLRHLRFWTSCRFWRSSCRDQSLSSSPPAATSLDGVFMRRKIICGCSTSRETALHHVFADVSSPDILFEWRIGASTRLTCAVSPKKLRSKRDPFGISTDKRPRKKRGVQVTTLWRRPIGEDE